MHQSGIFMNWFYECRTFEQGAALYKKLCKQYHPDLGGDTETMKDINGQWARFKKAHRPSPGARPDPQPSSSSSHGPRQQYRPAKETKSVRMKWTTRRSFVRTVTLIETTYTCRYCGQKFPLDWYPGSFKPLYCPEHRRDAKAAANRERQRRYREAHKK